MMTFLQDSIFALVGVTCCIPHGPAAEPLCLTTDGSFKQHLQWSPDGKRFLFTRIHQGKMALWTTAADGTDLKRLLPDLDLPHFDGHWSAAGKRIVYVHDQLQGTDGKDVTRLTREPAYDLHPAWSPDGKHIAFASGRTGRQKLFVMNADGSGPKKITDGEFLDSWPAWSPDGKRIAFVSNRTGNYDIWLVNADGTGLVNLTANPAQDTAPAWSPDGKKLAFISTRGGGSDVYVLEVK
jgi:TolB protein